MGEHKVRRHRRSMYVRGLGRELQLGLTLGLIMAALYCTYVVGLYLLRGARPFGATGITLGGAVATYVGGGLASGVLYGLLHPLGRSFAGAIVLGVLCASVVFFGVSLAMYGPPTGWGAEEWQMVGWLGLLFGAVCGPGVRWQMRR